ncbi:hypothetical protein E2C01_013044 [Portunus trituberculatus]|uniref:Uncharacterized protein n=1 Tax=Portunus trituberculatus TaxID=210409 RepID=A0A5B7DF96_PORTR|nr:hypothetical protein [Portunus trituberculatus]
MKVNATKEVSYLAHQLEEDVNDDWNDPRCLGINLRGHNTRMKTVGCDTYRKTNNHYLISPAELPVTMTVFPSSLVRESNLPDLNRYMTRTTTTVTANPIRACHMMSTR